MPRAESERTVYHTCDLCRKRKTRCVPAEDDATCTTCVKAKATCTFLNGYKRPGRPRTSMPNGSSSPGSYRRSESRVQPDPPFAEAGPSEPSRPVVPSHLPSDSDLGIQHDLWRPFPGLSPVTRDDRYPSAHDSVPMDPLIPPMVSFVSPASASTENPPAHSPAGGPLYMQIPTFDRIHISSRMTIDDVAPWNIIGDLLTFYLRFQHSLFPLVHKPSFSQALAERADRQDRNLAAFILGIVAYTIGQCPLSRLTSKYSREELRWLQKRCHLASLALVDRRYSTVTVPQIGTLMTGYFYCQSVGKTNSAFALLAEACQMTHILCLTTSDESVDWIERELRRRTFWHVYAVDTTEACAGHMIHLNAFEGFTPIPMAVDDELITTQGVFPQPQGTLSYMTGFVACMRLFPPVAECIRRQRQFKHRARQNKPCTPGEIQSEREWAAEIGQEITEIIMALPSALHQYAQDPSPGQDASPVIGMQRANILITEALLRMILHEYITELEPDAAGRAEEQAAIVDGAFRTISALGLDDLAANGESMRSKINRIFLHLLLRGDNVTDSWVRELHRWWTLYSSVQYVQLVPSNMESRFPSRAPSPVDG